jgi:hypothetical protein
MTCFDCHGTDPFCESCGGSGIVYCCDNAGIGLISFPMKPNWTDKIYPIVFAEDGDAEEE